MPMLIYREGRRRSSPPMSWSAWTPPSTASSGRRPKKKDLRSHSSFKSHVSCFSSIYSYVALVRPISSHLTPSIARSCAPPFATALHFRFVRLYPEVFFHKPVALGHVTAILRQAADLVKPGSGRLAVDPSVAASKQGRFRLRLISTVLAVVLGYRCCCCYRCNEQ